jgi:16S rRNA C967 or C1407 C5-methylase (RsmB/RsmF family)/NOL1/NOP2/fmu family ribosome biogenesis protein
LVKTLFLKKISVQIPQNLLNSLEEIPGFDREAFEVVHQSGEQITSIRLNPAKQLAIGNKKWAIGKGQGPVEERENEGWVIAAQVPWSTTGYYLSKRPSFTFDPLFHAGCYYVQEASSMFLEQALRQTIDLSQPLKVLDLCAAPGGKSTHIQSLISSDSLLVSNEVIRSRAGVLKQNIIKWGCQNVVVTNNDPQHFSRLEGFFDLMVVDAPCSGSGLFRRDAGAIDEWSEENVQLCCGRQKRILADALPALKEGGVLVYSTCSYSKNEDEDIAAWLVKEWNMQNIPLNIDKDWNIIESVVPELATSGYRFFPDKVRGEGFYLSCFRKGGESSNFKLKPAKLEKATAKEQDIVLPWFNTRDVQLFKANTIYAIPSALTEHYSYIKNTLNVQYAGVAIGEVMKDKLVPEHALALSNLVAESIVKTPVGYDEAIRYLQKSDVGIHPEVKGWQIITYEGHNLGWINALNNRINNYYPKEMRILKQM